MEWITWFVISFIALLLTLIQGGLEGCLTAGLLALAVSSVVAWLPFPFYIQAILFVLLIALIFVGLKKWEASSKSPLVSGWGRVKERPMSEVGADKASVVDDFSAIKTKKIVVSGEVFDAQPLLKSLYKKNGKKLFSKKFNSDIKINFSKALTGTEDDVNSFAMIATITRGSFEKLSLKGNFSSEEIVEMSIYQVDQNKKTLQVISDRARPFIKNFDFIKGFEGGKLQYESYIEKEITNSNKVSFTQNKSILEIMNIINSCKFIVGNETGPICLGASLKKEVHSIYLPIHTKPESQIISDKTFYYNTDELNDEIIINNITNRLLNKKI